MLEEDARRRARRWRLLEAKAEAKKRNDEMKRRLSSTGLGWPDNSGRVW